MRRRLLALALFAAASLPLVAQPPADGSNPFSGTTVTKASLERAIALHLDPAVQADLKLTADQSAALGRLAGDALAKHKAALDKVAADRKATVADRAKADAKRVAELDAALAKHLSADQMARVKQLRLQMFGLTAFRVPEVAAAVKLTDEQEKALTAVGAEITRRFDTARGSAGATSGPTGDRSEAARKALAAFVAGLTADQQAAWKALVGEPSPSVSGGMFFPSARTAPPATLMFAGLFAQLDRNEALQQELKLTPEQVTGVGKVRADFVSPGGRAETILARLVTQEVTDGAGKVLTPEQTARLAQIRLQLAGLGAFSRVEVLKAVKLTREQADAVEKAAEAAAEKAGRRPSVLRGEAPADPDRRRQELAEYQAKTVALEAAAIAGVVAKLDGAQKRAWDKLVGPAFDSTKLNPLLTDSRTFGPFASPDRPRASLGAIIIPASGWAAEAHRLVAAGDPAAGVTAFDEALKLKPESVNLLNGKAWLLATCPDDKVRDGKQALTLAEKAVALSKTPTPATLGTLAAAYAEVGRFDDAAAAQQKALAAATASSRNPQFGPSPTLPQGNAARLKLYQEKKPYRTPVKE